MRKININPIIEKIFKDFKVGEMIIPIAFQKYSGKSNAYLTYYTWSEKPDNFYDDEYHAEITYGTIDIFSTGNYKKILTEVKKKLRQNGLTWTDNGGEDFEDDTGYYHVPVNFYFAGNTEF